VELISIHCRSCEQGWTLPPTSAFSLHGQQAQESCPCPFCGAYTLCCGDADDVGIEELSPH
jgi:hypothetical protein